MDYTFDSELIESLNLLRPSVVRQPKIINKYLSVYCNTNNSQAFGKKITSKRKKLCTDTLTSTRHRDSSTSLVLNKTSETQIFKKYSVVSYTNLHCQEQPLQETKIADKNKPLIKVTVIPNSDIKNSAKLLRKQRVITKSIHSTSSNHENSIHTKNVYLVVAGRKKEKIYEIKTAGSAKFQNESKDGTIENIGTYQQLVQSLNMERKKRKVNKKDEKSRRNAAQTNAYDETPHINQACKCSSSPPEDILNEMQAEKSRVRIFGRLGMTEGDKYVLKCQATVNDKPVFPTSTVTENQFSPGSDAVCKCDYFTTNQRDSMLQTDFRKQELLEDIDNKNQIRKASQSTQVNFICIPSGNTFNTIQPRSTDQDPGYSCKDNYPLRRAVNTEYDGAKNTEYEGKHLKSSQSPLVIISVFSKPNNNISELVKSTQCDKLDCQRTTLPGYNNRIKITSENQTNMDIKNPIEKKFRSRSPSPRGPKTKPKKNNVEASHVKNIKAISPRPKLHQIEQSKKGIHSTKKGTLQFFNSNTKKKDANTLRTPSPCSPRDRSPCITKNDSPTINTLRQSLRPKPTHKVNKGINTEHQKTKKALVDSYTKSISKPINFKDKAPLSVSKVSVNIDSENEYYNLTFKQNNFMTDLNVRKIMKETGVQKSADENRKHGSMENFFPNMSMRHRANNYRQPICDQSIDVNPVVVDRPRLTVQDSLEISHRREDRSIKVTQTSRPDEMLNANDDMDFLAPIKHFNGDECIIRDPVERDREIRELLGVEVRKTRLKNDDPPQNQVFAGGKLTTRHGFYSSQQCHNTLIARTVLDSITCPCIEDDSERSEKSCDECDVKFEELYSNLRNSTSNSDNFTDDEEVNLNLCRLKDKRKSDNTNEVKYRSDNLSEFKRKTENLGETVRKSINPSEFKCKSTHQIEIKRKSMVHSSLQYEVQTEGQTDEQRVDHIDKRTEGHKEGYTEKHADGQTEGASLYQQLALNPNVKIFIQIEQFSEKKPLMLSKKQYKTVKKNIKMSILEERKGREKSKKCNSNNSSSVGQLKCLPPHYETLNNSKREVQANTPTSSSNSFNRDDKLCLKSKHKSKHNVDTVVLFSNFKDIKPHRDPLRQAVSSVEVRFESVSFMKQVTFSSTNVGSLGCSNFIHSNQHSLENLVRGHKKSHTPNLGTSGFSLQSEANISQSQSMKVCLPDVKTKKSFLKRLISCLVMRSGRASEGKVPQSVNTQPRSMRGSVDSYYISTSLGAIEMTSSLYDTSASFNSDHSIHPLSSKLKRRFFKSVRGFLASRKS